MDSDLNTTDTKGTQRSTKVFDAIPNSTEQLGRLVLDCAFRVHTNLGPGLLESVYKTCMVFELRRIGVAVDTEVPVPVVYEGVTLDKELYIDLLVGNEIIVELKAVEQMNPVYEAQLLTYLKLTGKRLGYLINFTVPHLKDGIRRRVV